VESRSQKSEGVALINSVPIPCLFIPQHHMPVHIFQVLFVHLPGGRHSYHLHHASTASLSRTEVYMGVNS
jgi:hypothetical protein